MDQTKLIKFLGLWVVNSVLLVVIAETLSNYVVLGNASLARGMAAVFSALLITLVVYLVPTAVARSEIKIKDERIWAVLNFIAIVIGVWVEEVNIITLEFRCE